MKISESPKQEHIKIMEGAEYLPIGIIEEYLDEISPDWEQISFTHEWKVLPTGEELLSGVIEMKILNRKAIGSYSMKVSGRETNTDYLATLQSFCISNCCKRMGKRFGRGLNNRLFTGETGGKPIDIPFSDNELKTSFTLKKP